MRVRTGDPNEGSVPKSDLLRRLASRGVTVETKGHAVFLSSGQIAIAVVLTDPVPDTVVRFLAERLNIDRLKLRFDRVESDLH